MLVFLGVDPARGNVMGGGYNTDVFFNNVRYHLQTEDKGAPKYEIVSHIYERGLILLTVRRFYREQLSDAPRALWSQGMITKQHKDILKVLKRGGIDLVRAYSARYTNAAANSTSPAPPARVSTPALAASKGNLR